MAVNRGLCAEFGSCFAEDAEKQAVGVWKNVLVRVLRGCNLGSVTETSRLAQKYSGILQPKRKCCLL
jgi:hypothetical protein